MIMKDGKHVLYACMAKGLLVLILAWAHEGEKMRFYVQSADIHFTTHV